MDAIMSAPNRRRGVLLLVVLSMLTLFLMLGAAYLTIATRARKAARAFANNSVAGSAANAAENRLLDAAFMTVARGVSAKTFSSGTVPYLSEGEDLLGDKYGNEQSVTGRITGVTLFGSSSALIQLNTTGVSPEPTTVSDLNGRVVTLMLPGLAASTRILQASGSAASPTLVVAAGPTAAGFPLSQSSITAALAAASGTQASLVINGREFDGNPSVQTDTNEPWDAVDSNNPLLAKTGSMSPLSMTATGASVDNDGDGTADSMFVDIGLPSITTSEGQDIYPRAAILVMDLDGRLNVNAHGSEADASTFNQYPVFNANTGTGAAIYIPTTQLPRGAPLGPASVSIARGVAFDPAGGTSLAKADLPTAGTQLIGGRSVSGANAEYATSAYYRETPRLGAVQGRSGDAIWDGSTGSALASAAGWPLVNDPVSRASDWWRAWLDPANGYTAYSYFTAPGRWGSPVDLRGRMRVWVDGFGQPVYYKPSWKTNAFNEVVDDPYEVNLTRLGSRTGYTTTPNGAAAPPDSLFTPADLEGLLRYYDPDSMKLPRRLVALSGTSAPKQRLMLTSESWDTPAVVGTAWQTVIGGTANYGSFLSTGLVASGSSRPQDLFSPETIIGHKMDLNRPFHDVSFDEPNDATGNKATGTLGRRQTFARQLYCLMASIARTNTGSLSATNARKLAQYAVNVADFRDADSVMTQFFYDPNFGPSSTNWSPGNNDYVWGCERPEVLMTETLAWHDRRTDDLSVGNKCTDTPASTMKNPDDDLDQSRRPWGGFFVELYSPWGSRACELVSGTVGNVLVGSGTARGEPVPATLTATGTAAFDRAGTLSLAKTAPGGAPLWRMASVLGKVQGGTGFDSSDRIVDPAAVNTTAVVDRVFYFTPPPSVLSTGTESGGKAAVFWASTVGANPSQSQYVVAGTDNLLFDYHDTFPDPQGNKNNNGYDNDTAAPLGDAPNRVALAYTKKVHIRFDMVDSATSGSGNASRPACASLTEPVLVGAGSNGNQDAYELLAEAVYGSNDKFTPDWHAIPHQYDDSKNPTNLQKPVDNPLDGVNPTDYGLTNISPRVLMKSSSTPVLMANGTHDNFAVVHLQRLANPTIAYNVTSNPYITVDSLTVDLTVVNTMNATDNSISDAPAGYTKANVDDPSIASQKQYRYRSVERGGRWTDTGVAASDPPAHDIWNSRVIASPLPALTANSAQPFRTSETSPRGATALKTSGITKQLQAAPGFGNAGDRLTSTYRAYNQDLDGNPITGMPSRFFKSGESETASPRFSWLWWANRPLNTVVELAMVPVSSPFDLPQTHTGSTGGVTAPNTLAPAFYHLPGLFEDTTPTAPWDAITGRTTPAGPSLFDFVHVPSPFAAVYSTVRSGTTAGIDATNAAALRQLGLDIFPLNQISNFREPGRVNVNTIPHAGVWRALFGSITAKGDPDVSATFPDKTVPDNRLDKLPGWDANHPVLTTLQDLYKRMPNAGESAFVANSRHGGYQDRFVTERDRNDNGTLDAAYDANNNGAIDPNDPAEQAEDLNGNGLLDSNDHRDTNRNAYFRYQTMNQLANVTTVRSNVFAVWVTIGYFDITGTEVTPVRRNRGFYIFDRSIPVGYERGRDHNVRDAILLRRVIE